MDTGNISINDLLKRQRKTFCFIGHQGSGKSTLVGSLMYHLDKNYREKYQKLQDGSTEPIPIHRPLEKPEEYKTGTKHCHIIPCERNDDHAWTFIDTPGDFKYIGNSIKGSALADYCIFGIDASIGRSEACLAKSGGSFMRFFTSLVTTSKNHWSGGNRIIFVISKLEEGLGNKSDMSLFRRYTDIVNEISQNKTFASFQREKIQFVPVSVANSQNLFDKSKEYDWYTGKSLLEAMEGLRIEVNHIEPLRISIIDKFYSKKKELVMRAKLLSGVLERRQYLTIVGVTGAHCLSSLLVNGKLANFAIVGDFITFSLWTDRCDFDKIPSGTVLGSIDDPVLEVASLGAHILIMPHSMTGKWDIKPGYEPMIQCGTQVVKATFQKILATLEKKSYKIIETNPTKISSGNAAKVLVIPKSPIFLQSMAHKTRFSRIMVRDHGNLIGILSAMSIEYKSNALLSKPNVISTRIMQCSDITFTFE